MKDNLLITLKAKKRPSKNGLSETRLYKNGCVFATFPEIMKQPRKGQKYIIINCWKYKLKWIN